MGFLSSLFSICPRVCKDGRRLVAATGWKYRILTLGCHLREVAIDPKKRDIDIRGRWFWLFSSRRRIRFGEIKAVTYGYVDWSMGSLMSWGHDTVDLFSVGLRLHESDDEVHFFNFYGDGTFRNDGPLPDWLYWEDYLCDVSGTQEKESRAFVDLLAKMMDVEVIPGRS